MKLLNEKEINELIEKYPLYSQDGKKGEAVALYHFFIGAFDWYVLEGSREGDNVTLYGIASTLEPELGYFSLQEMESITTSQKVKRSDTGEEFTIPLQIERDLYFKPTKLKDLRASEEIRNFINRIIL